MKHLNTLKKVLLPMLVMLIANISAIAQSLNGTYTVGGTSPDYLTLSLACGDLNIKGVSGPVIFNIRPGTYDAQHTIGVASSGISGTSATNTVTFQPDPANPGTIDVTNTANSSSNNFAIRLLDADYIRIKNLPISRTGSSYKRCIVFEGAATNNRVEGCTLSGSTTTSSSNSQALIYCSAVGSDDNDIINNIFTGGSSCVYLDAGSSDKLMDWVIDNNTMAGNYYTIYLYYTENTKVAGNTITKTGSGTFYGIYNYYAYGKCEIRNNTITKPVPFSSGTAYGIYQQYSNGTTSNYHAITGNTITLNNSTTSYGIYNNYGNCDSIANNDVNIFSSSSSQYPLYNYNSSGSNTSYGNRMITVNNTFNATGTSSASLNFYGSYYFKHSKLDNNIINLKGVSGSSTVYMGSYYSDSCTFNGNTLYDSTSSSITIYNAYHGSAGGIKGAECKNNNIRFRSTSSSMSTIYMGYNADNLIYDNNIMYFRASSNIGSGCYFGYTCNGMYFTNNDFTMMSDNSYVYNYLSYNATGAPCFVNNNTFTYTAGSSYAYMMHAYSSNVMQYNNNKITATVSSSASIYHYGNYNPYANGWEMIGNDIKLTASSGSVTGMYCYGGSSASAGGYVIAKNKVRIQTSSTVYNYFYYLGGAKIYNNDIYVNTSGSGYGMYLYYPYNNVDLYNNTLHIQNNITYGIYNYNAVATTTFRNNVITKSTGNGQLHYINNMANYQGDYNNYWSAGGPIISSSNTMTAWRSTSGKDRNSLSYNPGYMNAAAGDLRPDPANSNSWSLQGRGVHIPGNNTDITGAARAVVTSTGVPDIGAYEFTPTATAPACVATPAVPAAGANQTFTFGGDTVATISWATGSPVPASASDIVVKQYSGVAPPASFTTFNATHMYFYDSVGVNGAGPYNYSVRNYYKDPWIGTIASEATLHLAKKTIAGSWTGYPYTVSNVNATRNFINTAPTPSGLSDFGYYTGMDIGNNAGVGDLATPTGTFCPGTFAVSIYVKNNGNNVINNVKLDWRIMPAGAIQTINITTPIPVNNGIPGSNQIAVSLGNMFISNGPIIKAWTYSPNGQTDPIAADDTMIIPLHSAFTGTYIIDINNGPGTDYTTVVAAAADLNKYGLCGPATFRIRPGTYAGKVDITNVAGSNPTNRVTFMSDNGNASSVNITGGASTDAYAVKLISASYYTFKNLSFTGNAANGSALVWGGLLRRDSLIGCNVTAAGATSPGCAFDASPSGTGLGDGCVFLNNTFTGGYYVYRWNAATSAAGGTWDFVFDGNTINATTGNYYTVYIQTVPGFKVRRNTLVGASSSTYGYYIYNYYANPASAAIGGFDFSDNKVNFTLSTTTGYPVMGYYWNGYSGVTTPSVLRSRIANNYIGMKGVQYGWYLPYFCNTDVWNNTMIVDGAVSSYGTYWYNQPAWCTGNDIRNNVFANLGTSGGSYWHYWYMNPSGTTIDYNDHYFTGTSAYAYTLGGAQATLAAFKAYQLSQGWERNSIYNHPGITNAANPVPDPTNAWSWTLNGRGVHIAGNDRDALGNPRVTLLKDGAPDLGAIEFEPTVAPPACTAIPATATPGGSQLFMFGSDTVARINWSPTLLFTSNVNVRRYSGRVGINFKSQVSADRFMYFYTDIQPTNGTTFNYSTDIYYRSTWLGTIQKENELIMAERVGSFPWLVYGFGSSSVNTASKYIRANGLTSFGAFTGVDTPSVVSAIVSPASSTIFCTGGSVLLQANSIPGALYEWYKAGAGIGGADLAVGTNQNTYLATQGGDYYVKITAAGITAQSVYISVTSIAPPMALVSANGPLTYCASSNLVLSTPNQPGLMYQWTLNGTDISGADQNGHGVTSAGTYTVKVRNTGCTTTSTGVEVKAGPLTANLGADISACEKKNVPFVLDAGHTGSKYNWGLVGGNWLPDTTQTIAIFKGTGTYWVKVDGGPGCVDYDTIHVNVLPLPSATGVSYVFDEATNTYQFQAAGLTNVSSVKWIFNDQGNITESTQNPPPPQTYSASMLVQLVMYNDCGSDTVTLVNWLTNIPGTTKNSSTVAVSLYPNPASDKALLSIEGTGTMSQVMILNALGEVVYKTETGNVKSQELDLSMFANGRYLVRATTTGGMITKPLNVIR